MEKREEHTMLKNCKNCNTTRNYPKAFAYCPICGGELEIVKREAAPKDTRGLKEKVLDLYAQDKPVKTIATRLRTNVLTACDIINKELAKRNEVPNYVQIEYVEQIKPLVSNRTWDGKLKPIKEQLPEDCTYETISYVANLAKADRKAERDAFTEKVKDAIRSGMPVEEIEKATGASSFVVERTIVKMIREKEADADPYIQAEYAADIIAKASGENGNKNIKALKQELPEDCTYLTIKAVIAANDL